MINKLEKHNQKLKDKGIKFQGIGKYITGVQNPKLLYACENGHEFLADRARTMAGKTRCPSCGEGKNLPMNHEGYLNRLFNNEIDFDPIEQYQGIDVPIEHKCFAAGHVTRKSPNSVLRGSGCAKCSGLAKLTQDEYKQRLLGAGGIFQIVGDYAGQMTKVDHQCMTCNHVWPVKPHDIKNGSGCPDCALMGFSYTRPAKLYYVRIWDDKHTYYKIGITNNAVSTRMRATKKQYKILLEKQYETGREAAAAEQLILSEYGDLRIYAPQFLPNGGYTELFYSDVLLLDVDSEPNLC